MVVDLNSLNYALEAFECAHEDNFVHPKHLQIPGYEGEVGVDEGRAVGAVVPHGRKDVGEDVRPPQELDNTILAE